jgi:hypothetical protein
LQAGARFVEGIGLRIGARQLLDLADVTLRHVLEYSGECEFHQSDLLPPNVARSVVTRHGDDGSRRLTFAFW